MENRISIRRYVLTAGNLKNLKLREQTLPPPGPGEVRVAVRAVGLNFADIFAIWGLYGATPKGPFTPGLEYAGDIEALGPDVTHLRAGQRVMGVTRFGAYTTHLNIDARYVIPLPETWDYPTGAAYLVQTLTAYYGMHRLGALQRGQTVLLHSVAGGVGLQALHIARAFDCHVIGTVGDARKVDLARQAGCHTVIVRGPHFEQDLRAALGERPLELVMDSVGGRYFSIPYRLLAPMGRVVVFGSARYTSVGDRPNYLRLLYYWLTRPRVDPQKMPETNRAVLGFNLIWLYHHAELLRELLLELDAMQLPAPYVGHTFPFEEAQAAIRTFQGGKTMGKVVLLVS